jgi:PAS domain-containing protein
MVNEFAAAQRIAACGSWTWDRGNGQTAWSDECSRLLGIAPGAGPTSFAAWLERVHPDDRALLRAHHRRLCNGAARDQVVFRLAEPDAVEQRLESIGEAERDSDNRAQRVYGIVRPVAAQSTP